MKHLATLFLASTLVLACAEDGAFVRDGGVPCVGDAGVGFSLHDGSLADEGAADCIPASGAGLRAAVWELRDARTGLAGLSRALQDAGFQVVRLPLDRDPDTLGVDLIALGSFVSDDPRYATYASARAAGMQRFVDAGGTLLQLTQASEREGQPALLPANLSFKRTPEDIAEVFVVAPGHPLVANLAEADRTDRLILMPSPTPPSGIPLRPACWDCLYDQTGFSVLIAGRRNGEFPALLEGASASGAGRVLMTALPLDKLTDNKGRVVVEPEVSFRAQTFFRNLGTYVHLLERGLLGPPQVTAPYVPPAPSVFEPGSTSLIVFPDTQNYSYISGPFDGPSIFRRQTSWAAENLGALSTIILVNVGDIVERNDDAEWAVAAGAFGLLPPTQPLLLSTGNHDHGLNGAGVPRGTKFDQYFPLSRFAGMPTFGGALDTAENSYHLVDINGEPWVVLGLEWAPRDTTLAWAKGVLAAHANRRAIVTTHAYMYFDETRYDFQRRSASQAWNPHWYFGPTAEGAAINDGQEIWDELIRVSPNVRIVLSGHVAKDGLGRMVSKNDAGIEVHQLAVNYQERPLGGGGFLRIFEFLANRATVRARSYSPHLNTYLTDDQNQFEFTIAP
ncbi:MAG: metallophosphoesterase [Myxococcales bacterium]|nr:metallophosphoesterase [Myxococcales bacterium]